MIRWAGRGFAAWCSSVSENARTRNPLGRPGGGADALDGPSRAVRKAERSDRSAGGATERRGPAVELDVRRVIENGAAAEHRKARLVLGGGWCRGHAGLGSRTHATIVGARGPKLESTATTRVRSPRSVDRRHSVAMAGARRAGLELTDDEVQELERPYQQYGPSWF